MSFGKALAGSRLAISGDYKLWPQVAAVHQCQGQLSNVKFKQCLYLLPPCCLEED